MKLTQTGMISDHMASKHHDPACRKCLNSGANRYPRIRHEQEMIKFLRSDPFLVVMGLNGVELKL